MTVRELTCFLQQYPPGALVVLSKDAEGNAYSPLDSIAEGKYVADSTWSGEFLHSDDYAWANENLPAADLKAMVPAIRLGPVN